MLDRIAFNISVANTSAVDVTTILDYLEEHRSDLKCYRKIIPHGAILNDAFKFLAVLNTLGSLSSIASLIWDAYEKYIVPIKEDEAENSGFMISIAPNFREDPMMFWVGGKYKSREQFVQDFERINEQMKQTEIEYNKAVDRLMASPETWEPRKHH